MEGPLEREVKFRYDCAADARAAVVALGALPLRARRLQEDALFDAEDQRIGRQRSILRVRSEGQRSLLTFKGPVIPGPMKLREELETVVADGDVLCQVLERLGLRVWFRYQKYREEFSHGDVIIAVDETPIGVFIEIEGSAEGITAAAAALGRGVSDYILASYCGLFESCREALGFKGRDMVFDDPGRTS